MPYLVGLSLWAEPSQLNALAAGAVSGNFLVLGRLLKDGSVAANRDAGPVKSMPKSWLALISLPLHGLAYFLPSVGYVGTVLVNGVFGKTLEQPGWMKAFELPDLLEGETAALVRASACAAFLGVTWLSAKAAKVLGAQWHGIGVRERPKLVSSGAYGVVRHPLYSAALAQEILLGLMTWNHVPFISFAVTAIAFAVKMPYEEELMEEDPNLGPQYKAYKKRVRSRVIPYIW